MGRLVRAGGDRGEVTFSAHHPREDAGNFQDLDSATAFAHVLKLYHITQRTLGSETLSCLDRKSTQYFGLQVAVT